MMKHGLKFCQVQLIFIVNEFCIFKFTYSLEFTSMPVVLLQSFMDTSEQKKKNKKIKSFDTHMQIKQHSAFLFQLSYYKRVIFAVYLVPDFFLFLCFLLKVSLFKMTPGLGLKCYLICLSARQL